MTHIFIMTMVRPFACACKLSAALNKPKIEKEQTKRIAEERRRTRASEVNIKHIVSWKHERISTKKQTKIV